MRVFRLKPLHLRETEATLIQARRRPRYLHRCIERVPDSLSCVPRAQEPSTQWCAWVYVKSCRSKGIKGRNLSLRPAACNLRKVSV